MRIRFILLAFALLIAGHARADGDVTVETLAKSSASWNGTMLPPYASGQPEISILRIRIAPGATLPMHLHPVINAGVMISGELTVKTEKGEVLRLKAGEAIIEVVEQWHSGQNEGKQPAEIVVFYASTAGQPLSVKR
ncbi:MAG: cupin domain-containing protein [Alphaproteobacteria bacterium]|nr:cupin domain-containing protein [Alphaproteobacteria bacterium]